MLLADKVVGPFELEIQSIKAIRRLSTREKIYLPNMTHTHTHVCMHAHTHTHTAAALDASV